MRKIEPHEFRLVWVFTNASVALGADTVYMGNTFYRHICSWILTVWYLFIFVLLLFFSFCRARQSGGIKLKWMSKSITNEDIRYEENEYRWNKMKFYWRVMNFKRMCGSSRLIAVKYHFVNTPSHQNVCMYITSLH